MATYVYTSSQGQCTHSAQTNFFNMCLSDYLQDAANWGGLHLHCVWWISYVLEIHISLIFRYKI